MHAILRTDTRTHPYVHDAAVREYVVVPWVNEYNQRTNPGVVPSLHLHNVFASTISGGLVGGGLSAYFRT